MNFFSYIFFIYVFKIFYILINNINYNINNRIFFIKGCFYGNLLSKTTVIYCTDEKRFKRRYKSYIHIHTS